MKKNKNVLLDPNSEALCPPPPPPGEIGLKDDNFSILCGLSYIQLYCDVM